MPDLDGGPVPARPWAPIFVVGHYRSGTTWIYDVLTAHPEVGGAFETDLFDPERGFAWFARAESWHPVWIASQKLLTDHPRGLPQLVTRAELIQTIREIAESWLGSRVQPGERFLVEKSPMHALSLPVIAEVFPDARFVHALRDGRDVLVSMRAAGASWNRPWKKVSGPVSLWQGAEGWARTVSTVRAAANAGDLPVFEVRYERMRAEPHEWARRLFEFCRIPASGEAIMGIVDSTDFSRVRMKGHTRFHRRGQVGEWRDGLSPAEHLLVLAAAGDVLESTGYVSRRSRAAETLSKIVAARRKAPAKGRTDRQAR